jgi:hypothetical protein
MGDGEQTQPQYAECRDTSLVDLRNFSYEAALQHIEAALSQDRSLTTLFELAEKEVGHAPRNPYYSYHNGLPFSYSSQRWIAGSINSSLLDW